MAEPTFKSEPLRTPSLFPQDIFKEIPENHPVKLVNYIVDNMDISEIMKTYKGGGTSAYHPGTMLKILFYGYLDGKYSARKIAKATRENIYFMWLAGRTTPDFRTINNFRSKRLKNKIHKLFKQLVITLSESGYVSLDVQYTDGTKIEANANRYTFVWRKNVKRYKQSLEKRIEGVIREIEAQIKEDGKEMNKEELPMPIDSESVIKKLKEVEKRLETQDISKSSKKKVNNKVNKVLKEYVPKLQKYETQLEKLGERNSYSKTDEDATFMRTKDDHLKNGQLKPCYNVQVSTENQVITNYTIHQDVGDTTTLKSHIDNFETLYKKQIKELVADSGYGSEENYEYLLSKGITPYVKYNYFHKEKSKKFRSDISRVDNWHYNSAEDYFVCGMGQRLYKFKEREVKSKRGYPQKLSYYRALNCNGCPVRGVCNKSQGNRIIRVNHRSRELRKAANELLVSERGHSHRKKRSVEVESVFGQIKQNRHFRRFSLRSLPKVNIEFGLIAIAHNLGKLYSYLVREGKNILEKLQEKGLNPGVI